MFCQAIPADPARRHRPLFHGRGIGLTGGAGQHLRAEPVRAIESIARGEVLVPSSALRSLGRSP